MPKRMGRKRKLATRQHDVLTQESIPVKKALEAESSDTAVLQAFGNSVIFRTILNMLSIQDLFNCSLVSKKWNYEAHCALRDFRVCSAEITGNSSPFLALKKLNDVLSGMTAIPYTGLRIKLNEPFDHRSYCRASKSLNECCDFMVSHWILKYLELNIDIDTSSCQFCPAIQLIKWILLEMSESLQEVSILNFRYMTPLYPAGDMKIYRSALTFGSSRNSLSPGINSCGRLSLPKIKIVRVSKPVGFPDFLPNLVSAAPNLEELSVQTYPEDLRSLSPGVLKTFKTLLFIPLFPSDEEPYRALALARPQLRDLHIHPLYVNMEQQRKFLDILRVIIESSCNSLEFLSLETPPAFMVEKFVIQPLRKVTSLELALDFSQNATAVPIVLRRINFSELFPSLNSVSIYLSGSSELEVADVFNRGGPEFGRDATAAIRKMYISSQCFYHSWVQSLSEVFPNVVELKADMLHAFSQCGEVISSVWSWWPSIESIHIEKVDCHGIDNLDAVFCGITPQEAEILQGKNDEFLRKVNIVPIRPSITCCRRLKKLNLVFSEDPFLIFDESDSVVFLSKVTGLVAFKRMPDLEVMLELSNCRDLRHLIPFANINGRML